MSIELGLGQDTARKLELKLSFLILSCMELVISAMR